VTANVKAAVAAMVTVMAAARQQRQWRQQQWQGGRIQQSTKMEIHGGQDDSILRAKLVRIAPENSSF
jgi:hypothetical protein